MKDKPDNEANAIGKTQIIKAIMEKTEQCLQNDGLPRLADLDKAIHLLARLRAQIAYRTDQQSMQAYASFAVPETAETCGSVQSVGTTANPTRSGG